MEAKKVPFKKVLFVCTNTREGGRVACANPGRGGDAILHALKDAVKDLKLKGKVRVARSGCMDLCELGPNLMVWPEGTWIQGVKEADIPELIREHLRPLTSTLPSAD